MVLAAGRGERMRPLTDHTPKPLLPVRGKPLIVYHLEALGALGVRDVVINLAWLGDQIRAALGDGSRWNLQIRYSDEGSEALETGGGIFRALPWLGTRAIPGRQCRCLHRLRFRGLADRGRSAGASGAGAQSAAASRRRLRAAGRPGRNAGPPRWTYSGIGLYRPALFDGCSAGKFPLRPLLDRAIAPAVCMASAIAASGAMSERSSRLEALQIAGLGLHLRRTPMDTFKGIPVVAGAPARSGQKYVTPQGFTAIKDGIKPRRSRRARAHRQAALAAGAAAGRSGL